jgi:anti-anti-sigma factor
VSTPGGDEVVVLVGYATEHGSTRDVADWVAARCGEHGVQAKARSAAEHDAVVLGSAVHDQKWLPEESESVQRNIDVPTEAAARWDAPESPCQVELRPLESDGVRVVGLSGVPGMRDSRRVHEAMVAALLDAPKAVVIDLSGVRRIDSDGFMLLVLMRRHARRLGATLPVAGAAPAVARALRRFDLNGLFSWFTTVPEAVTAHSPRSTVVGVSA